MKIGRKYLVFGMIFLFVIINLNLIFAQESETFVIAGREFTEYGNITVETYKSFNSK